MLSSSRNLATLFVFTCSPIMSPIEIKWGSWIETHGPDRLSRRYTPGCNLELVSVLWITYGGGGGLPTGTTVGSESRLFCWWSTISL